MLRTSNNQKSQRRTRRIAIALIAVMAWDIAALELRGFAPAWTIPAAFAQG